MKILLLSLWKNTEDDHHLNNSYEDAGLISPDKEDISRILVEKMLRTIVLACVVVCCVVDFFIFYLNVIFQTVPFSGRIRGGMRPGKKIIIMGIIDPEPNR